MEDRTDNPAASTVDAYYWHVNCDANNDSIYGLVYNWAAVMGGYSSSKTVPSGVQGICPNGWHLPSDTEWTILEDYAKMQYQCYYNYYDWELNADLPDTGYAKALAATISWSWQNWDPIACKIAYDQSSNNASGFSAVAAGYAMNGTYQCNGPWFHYNAYFWTASQSDGAGNSDKAYARTMSADGEKVYRMTKMGKANGFSVRCIKN